MWLVLGHYSDIPGISAGGYSDRDHYDYPDIDQMNLTSRDGADQRAAGSRNYDLLDPSVLATLRQPQRPHDYDRLGAAASTQQTTEQIEMNVIDDDDDYQDAVRRQL